jgi:hypothetical protein
MNGIPIVSIEKNKPDFYFMGFIDKRVLLQRYGI